MGEVMLDKRRGSGKLMRSCDILTEIYFNKIEL